MNLKDGQRKWKTLPPIRERTSDYDAIERELIQVFKREIYLPLLRELNAKQKLLSNSYDDLIQAIASGQIQFVNGHFQGRFDAAISKELKRLGASWDRKHGWWKLPASELTYDMRAAIGTSKSRFEDMAARVNKRLDAVLPEEVADKMRLEKLFESAIYKVHKDFNQSVESVSIPLNLSDDQKRRISEEWANNLRIYVRDFTEKETASLREKISQNAAAGARFESMVDSIKQSFGVTQNKAKFLARQETSLLMTKYKQTRYEEAGVNEYIWVCVHMPHQAKGAPYVKGQVRFHHGELEGKIFSWKNPPVVNDKGERKNPGQDYNCRCFARPIVRF